MLSVNEQVDKAETSQRSVEERAEIFAKMIAAFNEAKGSIRQSLTAGTSLISLLHSPSTLHTLSASIALYYPFTRHVLVLWYSL